MAYATSSNITARYSNAELLIVADRDGNGTADTDIITTALSDASAEIDAHLSLRYALPFTSIPAVLVRICVDIAMYRMAENAAAMTDERRRRYDDAIAFLKMLANGDLTLGADEPTDSAPNEILHETESRVWTRTLGRGLF
jgi:phage gp36-like protein